jgi:hexosaminidase
MISKKHFFFLVLLFISCKSPALSPNLTVPVNPVNLIPLPSAVTYQTGTLTIDKNIIIIENPSFSNELHLLQQFISQTIGDSLAQSTGATDGIGIRIEQNPQLKEEEYSLVINPKGIVISAKTATGAFWAIQSLKQLIWQATNDQHVKSFTLQALTIVDSPKYAWRGFHVDVSRHFFSKEFIENLIDWIALYKFNKLQLHLTDDQGWRVQIDSYPLLSTIGAWRPYPSTHDDSICIKNAVNNPLFDIDRRFLRSSNGTLEYGGFYTKEDISQIVNYAAQRHIDVIPEIDMPGHMSAAIKAYPFLSCAKSAGWGTEFSTPIFPSDSTLSFAYAVWDEVISMFPSEYVHIGGDEVDTTAWVQSPDYKSFLAKHQLSNAKQVELYFLDNLQQHLTNKGKKVIMWDDVTDLGNVNPIVTIMYWRDWMGNAPQKAAQNNNDLIFTPWNLFYLSGENSDQNLKDLYQYAVASQFSSQVVNKLTGFQGCVWTEDIPSERLFEYQIFPRLQALSELSWSHQSDWVSFQNRLVGQLHYLSSQNILYFKPAFIH